MAELVHITPSFSNGQQLVQQQGDIITAGNNVVKIISITNNCMVFVLQQTLLKTAAKLQRIIMNDVSTMAIDCVGFNINTSVMNNEEIAHRLGLFPLYSQTVDEYEGGPHNCEELYESGMDIKGLAVMFGLYVKAVSGPYITRVTEKELIPLDPQNPIKPVQMAVMDSNGNVTEASTTILNLREGQEIKLIAYAVRGKGVNMIGNRNVGHAKYIPVSNIYFQQIKTYDDGSKDIEFHIESKGMLSPLDILKKALALM